MQPRKKFRTRPKKTGAKKKYRVLTQKRRLVAAGYKMEKLAKMTVVEIRDLLKLAAKRKAKKAKIAGASAKKSAKKSSVK